jgi:predicted LPLAT superfamily acyltransferase
MTKYKNYVTPINYDKDQPRKEQIRQLRKEQIRQLSEAYVAELEKRVLEYPTQWYNFFDFWN